MAIRDMILLKLICRHISLAPSADFVGDLLVAHGRDPLHHHKYEVHSSHSNLDGLRHVHWYEQSPRVLQYPSPPLASLSS